MRGKVYFLFYLSIVLQEAKAFTLEIGEGGLFNNNKEKKFQVLQKFFFFFLFLYLLLDQFSGICKLHSSYVSGKKKKPKFLLSKCMKKELIFFFCNINIYKAYLANLFAVLKCLTFYLKIKTK